MNISVTTVTASQKLVKNISNWFEYSVITFIYPFLSLSYLFYEPYFFGERRLIYLYSNLERLDNLFSLQHEKDTILLSMYTFQWAVLLWHRWFGARAKNSYQLISPKAVKMLVNRKCGDLIRLVLLYSHNIISLSLIFVIWKNKAKNTYPWGFLKINDVGYA